MAIIKKHKATNAVKMWGEKKTSYAVGGNKN
jgi:hypothetical protein